MSGGRRSPRSGTYCRFHSSGPGRGWEWVPGRATGVRRAWTVWSSGSGLGLGPQGLAGHRVHAGAGRVHAGQVVPRAARCTPRSRNRRPGPCAASSGVSSVWVATQRPPEGSRAPNTKVTSTRSASSQMGHCSPDGRPRLRAARSSSGWASHTSSLDSRPLRNSLTTALRASRYSTCPPVGEVRTPSSDPGRKLTRPRVMRQGLASTTQIRLGPPRAGGSLRRRALDAIAVILH